MYLCYIDESGTSQVPGNTSHFILAGLSIPIWFWKRCDQEIYFIKRKYSLDKAELHVAWMMRRYPEQESITDFNLLDSAQRRSKVNSLRTAKLLYLQTRGYSTAYQRIKKFYQKTADYIHLSHLERCNCIKEVADCVGNWGFARLFAEVVDKRHFDPLRAPSPLDAWAFEQVVSRFETYLQHMEPDHGEELEPQKVFGLLIHDNNQTIAKRHTDLMRGFHFKGTLWTTIKHIIETPLFVDSSLTSMVQVSDLCAYALRRYVENQETALFDEVFKRADRKGPVTVGCATSQRILVLAKSATLINRSFPTRLLHRTRTSSHFAMT
jgi:hypothetical protein